MRREGRRHGWVYAVDRSLVDLEVLEGPTTGNGGFVKVSRKPTNHSKPAVGRAFKILTGSGKPGAASSGKRVHKFKHDEVKMYYLDREGADDAAVDALMDWYDDEDA